MGHNSLIRGGGWAGASTILGSELATLDANLAGAINGDDGGCWAPAAAITIGGSGMAITGPLVVARGGLLTAVNGDAIQFASGQYPRFAAGHAGRTRKIVSSFAEAHRSPTYLWRSRRDSGGIQSVAPVYTSYKAPGVVQPTRLLLPLRPHQGATLSNITIGFRVPTLHPSLPPTMPQARMLRIDTSGNAVAMTSQAAGADPTGFVGFTKPPTAAAWYMGGAGQSFAFACDQHNTVDRTLYTYALELLDEQWPAGTAWPFLVDVKAPVDFLSAGVTSALGTQDGFTPTNGQRALVINDLDLSADGLWVAHAGAWTRPLDFQAATDFSQGMLVLVRSGHVYGGTVWQSSANVTSWTPGTEPVGTNVWSPTSGYSLGTSVSPNPGHQTGFWYQCTTAGTSGGSEPTWPSVAGQTVTDGSVVWTCEGRQDTPLTFVMRGDADAGDVSSAWYAYGNIYQSVVVEYDGIADGHFQ